MILLTTEQMETRRKLRRLMEKGRLTPQEAFEQALESDPFDDFALTELGQICEEKGRREEAQQYYWRAMEAQPCSADGYMLLWQSLRESGEEPKLVEELVRLVYRGLTRDPERSERVQQRWRDLMEPVLEEKPPGHDVEALQEATTARMIETPPEGHERLRPYWLVQDVIDPPEDGMSAGAVDLIIDHAEECTPLLIGIVRAWARGEPDWLPSHSARLALALLGETGDVDTIAPILADGEILHAGVQEAAFWAAARVAGRRKDMNVPPLPPEIQRMTVYTLCCSPPVDDDEWGEDDEQIDEPYRKRERPGRNEPCWCGSGKKYKKCHLTSDEELDREDVSDPGARTASKTGYDRASAMLMSFVGEVLGDKQMKQALKLFFAEPVDEIREADQIAFFDWLLHDYTPPHLRRTVPEEYLARNRGRLPAADRAALEEWINSRHSLFEVQRVEPGEGVELTDLLMGDTFFVHDVTSSRTMVRWDQVLSRIADDEGRKVFTGTGLSVPAAVRAKLRDWIVADQEDSDLKWSVYLQRNSHRLRQRCGEFAKRCQATLQVVTAEGDEMVFAKVIYDVLDEASLLERFEAAELIGDRDDRGEEITFSWFETPEVGTEPRRVLGSLRIRSGEMVLECTSRQRMERGILLIRKVAAETVKEKSRELKDVQSALSEPQPNRSLEPEPEIPKEVKRKAEEEYLEEHYRRWPDTPLPALDGLTPRQAAGKPEIRKRLIELLKLIENGEERKRRSGATWYDVSKIARELDVVY